MCLTYVAICLIIVITCLPHGCQVFDICLPHVATCVCHTLAICLPHAQHVFATCYQICLPHVGRYFPHVWQMLAICFPGVLLVRVLTSVSQNIFGKCFLNNKTGILPGTFHRSSNQHLFNCKKHLFWVLTYLKEASIKHLCILNNF